MTNTIETALALVKNLDFAVFPWKLVERDGKEAKQPITPRGHLDATRDEAQIRAWFQHPGTRIGIHAEASRIIVVDLDRKHDKNGFESSADWLDLPETFRVDTNNNGAHLYYNDPRTMRLRPSADWGGFHGVDVRAGSSWVAWWGDEVPTDRSVFAEAPSWVVEEAPSHVGSAFEGGLDDWLETLVDPDGEPAERVLAAIERIPDTDFGHVEMVEQTWNIVRLASEGAPGVLHALTLLRDAWLREPYDTSDNRYSFDKAVEGAIKKAGALDEKIANLPVYMDLLDDSKVAEAALSTKREKADWFRHARTFIRFAGTDDEVASLLWSAPATKDWSREWGIEFVYERIVELREQIEAEDARAEAEVERFRDEPSAVDAPDNKSVRLLSDDEREFLAQRPNFVHRYVEYARDRFPMMNEPYHRANAWTLMSMTLGATGFTPLKGKNLGLNLFQITLGESSTGKSDSLLLRDEILRLYFQEDGAYDMGSEASGEMAHEHLLERNGQPTLFHADEAAVFFRELTRPGSWQAKLQDKLTDAYGGWIGPVFKRAYKGENKGSVCHLVSHFFGTPDRLYGVMETDQFLSGFLARFQWSVGEPPSSEKRTVDDMQDDSPVEKVVDPRTVEMVDELRALVSRLGRKRPFKAGRPELARLLAAEAPMMEFVKSRSDWKITESAYRRLVDALRKCCALLAASRGSIHIEMVDVLGSLEQAEAWLVGLVEAASNVSASAFEREAREIANAVRTMGHPWVTETRLANRFSRYNEMEWKARVEWMVRQGLVVVEEANREHSKRYGWKGREVDE